MVRVHVAIDQTSLQKACICSPASGIVLERNVEVGQIGASSFQAPVLFTLKAIVLSMIGGALGIALGLLLAVFGYFPVRRAARLDPIEALRYQ